MCAFKWLLWLVIVVCIFRMASLALGDENQGVKLDTQERVVTVPQDQGKWHISVVGEGARYEQILSWFETGKLATLKSQVFFHPVTTKSTLYKERYQPNVKALPTVRVQDGKGTVIYESAGKEIPMSADGLYGAIANANSTNELLPWRRRHANPEPQPEPTPEPDPIPTPDPIDESAPPVFEEENQIDPTLIVLLMLLLGVGVGVFEASKAYHNSKHK